MIKLSDQLKLPTEIASQAVAVLGIRGSGKTNTAGVLAEELLAIHQPVVVVDPTDAWWGLRSSADGKREGFPIIIAGGSHGDLPLGEGDGKALAEFLVAEQVSAVLSVRHLRKEAQRRFFVSLAEELYHLKGKAENRSALTLIIDEASSFVPQDVRGDMARSAGAVEDIVNRGRNVGFGVVMINQRAATLNKNVLTQCDTLVIHRMPSPQDRKAIRDWVEENSSDEQAAEVLASLASLKTGDAWFWSPAIGVCQRVKVRLKTTFDSSRTPKIGEAPRQPKKLAEIDLASLKGKMATSIEQAKASDPKLLKAKIAELEKEIKKGAAAKSVDASEKTAAAIEKVVVTEVRKRDAFWAEEMKGLRQQLAKADKALLQIAGLAGNVKLSGSVHVPPEGWLGSYRGHNKSTVSQETSKSEKVFHPFTPKVKPPRVPADGELQLNKTQQRILDALAWYESIGVRQPTNLQVGAIAMIDTSGGYFSNSVGPLSSAGLVERANGAMQLTDAGRERASVPENIGTLADYHAMLRSRVNKSKSASGKTVAILDCIIAAGGDELTVGQIGEAVGIDHTGGYFSNTIGPLSTLGLIVRNSGKVTPTSLLFPENVF